MHLADAGAEPAPGGRQEKLDAPYGAPCSRGVYNAFEPSAFAAAMAAARLDSSWVVMFT